MNIFKAFAPITKVDDEQRMVYGYASTDSKDSQGEIVKSDAIEAALPDYMRFANIREMHTMSAVGVAKSAEVNEGGLYIGAKVVDDVAWKKVKEGVYKGFSIGGKALEKANGIISKLRLTEISLVDRPANPECVIDTWKAEALDDDDQVAKADEQPAEKSEQQASPAAVDHFGDIRKAAEAVPYEEGKPIWDASRALSAMGSIFDLLCSESYEKEAEPEQQASLRTAIEALKAFVIAELQERVENGVVVAMADGAGDDVAKAGAMYSKGTKAALANIHKMLRDCDKAMIAMGYDKDDMDKADDSDDVAKAHVGIITADDELKKAATDVGLTVADEQPLTDLAKAAFAELAKSKTRIAELEAQPEPAKAATTTIEKSDDTNGGLASPAQLQGDPNDPLSMFKAVLARPINMVGN